MNVNITVNSVSISFVH